LAKIFPEKVPEEILNDPLRSSEIQIYTALKEQLDSDYHVYYSSPWLGTRPDGSEIDGEADFLVAHSVKGLLAIEVKGGRVAIDNHDKWTSTDRHGFKRKVKNPVKQALSSKYQILKKLNNSPHWTQRYINANHGVILPHSVRPGRDFRPDMPLNLFAFDTDVNYLDSWVSARMEPGSDRYDMLGADGLYALEDMFTREIRLKVRLGTHINQDMKEISLKTDEQILIIREMEDNPRMTITGAAGTGKTVLAIEKALMMAEENKKVLLLCFNRPLGLYLGDFLAKHPTITATHFHQYCSDMANASGAEGSDFTQDSLENSLIDNFVDAGLEEYDAVIIDEGQDFKDSWLNSLEVVVANGDNGVFYIFYDDNQNVMRNSVSYINGLISAKYRLTRNFRNTKKIFRRAEKYYTGKTRVRPIGPEGTPLAFHEAANDAELKSVLAARVGSLIKTDRIPAGDIAVLFPDSKSADKVKDNRGYRIGPYRASNSEHRCPDMLCVDTIRRFKGLESPVILLVINGDTANSDELLYAGLTRAQAALEIIGPRHAINRVRDT
jgi:hypothetical protein